MKRRKFITLLGGAAAMPLTARAQQGERMRRVGVLMSITADNPESPARAAAFVQGLRQLGWTVGQNVVIDYRWDDGSAGTMRKYAEELVALAPDVIVAHSSTAIVPLAQATRTVPIVFTIVADPVGAGYVESLARPGGNVTGFTNFEYSIGGKWLELLREIAPKVGRAAVLRDAAIAVGLGQFGAIQTAAAASGMELSPVTLRDASEIERSLAAFARSANGGMIVTASALAAIHRGLIIELAARYKLPAIYYERNFVAAGGLISYGPNFLDLFQRAASYVDRIFKGEKPSDLPVQTPTKYELAINLKTAKALGLAVPNTLLVSANELIE
jgi:putative ABC transport system substrate-binding protein